MGAFEGAVCDVLAAISRFCGQHGLGLSNAVELIEAGDVTSIAAPDADTHTVSTDVTLDATKFFYQWLIGDTEAEFTSTAIGSKGNQTFQNTLTFFLPLSRDAVTYVMNGMINGQFIIRFGDKNGGKRLLGTNESPAMIPEGGIQEVINAERHGYTVTFENIGPLPVWYTGAAPLV